MTIPTRDRGGISFTVNFPYFVASRCDITFASLDAAAIFEKIFEKNGWTEKSAVSIPR